MAKFELLRVSTGERQDEFKAKNLEEASELALESLGYYISQINKPAKADKIVKDLRDYVKDKTRIFGSTNDGRTRKPREEAIVECLSNIKYILDRE